MSRLVLTEASGGGIVIDKKAVKLPETLYLSGTLENAQAPPGWTGFIALQWDGAGWVATTRVISPSTETPT
jgi:hypothetical protein